MNMKLSLWHSSIEQHWNQYGAWKGAQCVSEKENIVDTHLDEKGYFWMKKQKRKKLIPIVLINRWKKLPYIHIYSSR